MLIDCNVELTGVDTSVGSLVSMGMDVWAGEAVSVGVTAGPDDKHPDERESSRIMTIQRRKVKIIMFMVSSWNIKTTIALLPLRHN